ncbi:calcium ATPase [Marasmius fiardii PR-910]|nr:calcium ATPase [Marasmius fiardii PR-910]
MDKKYLVESEDVENGGSSDHTRFRSRRSTRFGPSPSITPSVKANPEARVIAEFRTLSIHVTDTQAGGQSISTKDTAVKDLSTLEWHTLPVNEVCNLLGVTDKAGLDLPMVARRQKRDGKNIIKPPPSNLGKKIFFGFFGGFGSLLFGSSIICFIAWRPLGDPNPSLANLALAIVLLITMIIQAVFNLWQDYTTGRVMASIKNMLPLEISVVREGSVSKIPAADLVQGDLVQIKLGNKVPADLRLIQVSSDLRFDRSILTGESVPVPGTTDNTNPNFMESKNIALQGTLCTNGNGLGVVVGVGNKTVFGQIAQQSSGNRPVRTTLEIEILRFVLIIASLAASVCLIILILWAAWLRRDHPGFIPVPVLLIDLVSVAVAFIPEGLPICVTLSLTVIAYAMKKNNIIAKSLSTVESLGAVSFICSDKTGTLTQNKMTVVNLGLYYDGDFKKVSLEKAPLVDEEGLTALATAACLCNEAVFEGAEEGAERKISGDATDSGLLRFSDSILSVPETRQSWNEVGKLPFNSTNKFAVTLFKSGSPGLPTLPSEEMAAEDILLIVKGAPDVLLPRCSFIVSHLPDASGLLPLTTEIKNSLVAAQEHFAGQGQRVLLIARRILPLAVEVDGFAEDKVKNQTMDLAIIGLVALMDPLKDEAAETVKLCRRAGIRFSMVTGDYASTAVAIARDAGIVTTRPSELKHLSDLPHDLDVSQIPKFDTWADDALTRTQRSLVLSGPEIMTMTESQWKQALTFDELVFARTSPQQKLQIVRAFQGDGCCVAVTGDGVNDAPALKQADVGVAIAGGSDVAIEAADLVLLDKFSDIVSGIEYGRLCFENLRKSIVYLLPAGSFSELMPVVLNVIFGVPQALSSIQMILICVFTDLFPALSMVFEKPEADLLLRRPRNRKTERLVDGRLLLHAYGFIGVIHSLTAMTGAFYFGFQRGSGIPFSAMFLKFGEYDVDPDYFAEATNRAQSIYFFNLVIIQWGNLIATRTRRLSLFHQNPLWGRGRNVWLVPAMAIALGLACLFSYLPWFQRVFLTRGVAAQYYFLPMAYGVALVFADETRKYLNRKYPKSLLAKWAW